MITELKKELTAEKRRLEKRLIQINDYLDVLNAKEPQLPIVEEPKKKKATRLPVDWECDTQLGNWAMEQGMMRDEVISCIDSFKDHYSALSGKGSTALDWNAKFRTWIRNQIKWRA